MAKTKKELAEEEIGEPVEVEVKRPLDKIVPIRLSADDWAELYKYARTLGIGPTTLARMWILEKLAFVRAMPARSYVSTGVPFGVPLVPNWGPAAPVRLTSDEFMRKLVSALPDDVKQNLEQWVKDTVIPQNAEKAEDIIGFFGGAPIEQTQQFFRAIAKLMGVEVVDEEAKAGEPKSEDRKSEVKS